MQQAAINLALTKTKQNGKLFSVNGPPGTGKTTMLRDIIAALIVERAEQLPSLPVRRRSLPDNLDVTTCGR